MTPASIIPVFGSQRPYADLNFAGGSFGLDGRSVSDLTALPGFTFTRASLAMGYDATGKLVYGPNNLLLQSQTFGTTWTPTNASVASNTVAAPDGTLTADTLVEAAGAGQKYITQNVSGLATVTGRVISVYAKYAGRQYLAMYASGGSQAWFDLQGGTVSNASAIASIESVGNGWYRCTISKSSWSGASDTYELHTASVAGSFTYTGDGTSGIYLWGAQLEAVTYQTTPSTYYPTTTAAYYGPRLVYDPVTLASQGILVEEARTNSVLQSNTFDNASWTKAGATITANSTTSPDGTTNAAKFADAGAGANHFVYQLYTVTNGSTWTHSVYAKKGSFSWFIVNPFNSTNYRTWFNLDTGVVGVNAAGNTASITSVGNGWYRCSVTRTMVGTAAYVELELASADGVVATTVGDVFIYGAQAELGTGASSPIPTTTASVTRAADVAAVTGLSVASESTVVIEWTRYPFSVATFPRFFTITDGTSNNLKAVYGSGGNLWSQATVGGASQGDVLAGSGQVADTGYKLATRWAVGSRRSALNGTLGTLGTADIASAVLTQMHIGCSLSGTTQLNGTISRIRIYNRALPDSQLQSLTT